MAVASPEVLARMPLSEAVMTLWCWVADDAYLDQIFDRHRGRSYEKILSFPLMVRLIRDALIEHEGSGRKSFEHAEERDELDASSPLARPMAKGAPQEKAAAPSQERERKAWIGLPDRGGASTEAREGRVGCESSPEMLTAVVWRPAHKKR
jgi:hypothetical protein